ncbi:hypothetical protein D770_05130 [Flammeovirgaceae bacterium 311]|nr:hypothetical protein D770_05130 [Flammeovirgaceae bacterium 311]
MKTITTSLSIVTLMFVSSCNGQTVKKQEISYMDIFELSPESAHPKAKELLTEDFYWSPINESGPFGSDDGSDAFYGFMQWRQSNARRSPVKYLDELLTEWGLPKFDIYELDTNKINAYLINNNKSDASLIAGLIPEIRKHYEEMGKREGKEFDEASFQKSIELSNQGMGQRHLLGIDNAIIAVGFGQFVIEGKMDDDIKSLTKIALTREQLPIMLEQWGEYKDVRKAMLAKMLADLDKM